MLFLVQYFVHAFVLAAVDEALTLLGQDDIQGYMGMMVHFAPADTNGRSVVAEYVTNKMLVTETPIISNFYLSEDEKTVLIILTSLR